MPARKPSITGNSQGAWRKKPAFKIIVSVALLAGIIILSRAFPPQEWLEKFNLLIDRLGYFGYLVFFVVYVVATVLFLPGSVLTIGAGLLFGVVGGSLAVSVASTTGSAFCFLIGRYIVRDRIAERLSRNQRFEAVDAAIGQEGGKVVLLLRLSPLFPFNALNYLLGLTAVKFWHYVVASWVGMMPGTVLYVYLGFIGQTGLQAAAGTMEKGPLKYAFLGFSLVVTVLVTIFVTKIARKALHKGTLGVTPPLAGEGG